MKYSSFSNLFSPTIFSLVLFFVTSPLLLAQVSHTLEFNAMGSYFQITCVSEEIEHCKQSALRAKEEINRIETLISSWTTTSETAKINQYAGIKPVVVSRELFSLIERSIKISNLTDGAFDVSFAAIEKIWAFNGQEISTLPKEKVIKQSIANINYKNVVLNKQNRTVFLKKQGMKIGFGAIGKGYAAERAKQLLQDNGIKNGLVNAGGDLTAWGNQPNGKPWLVGITNPNDKTKIVGWLTASNKAVVTSGDYEKFLIYDGQRFAHIINPKTGYPTTGIKSVTIITTNAELADALATAIFVLGTKNGLSLVNQLNGVECLIVTDDNNLLHSNNLKTNWYEKE